MPRLITILVLLLGLSSWAQKANELTLYFDEPAALKKAGVRQVRCIFKDSRRLLWIGTENGLFRFDGTSVDYRRRKAGDRHGIPNNIISSICEDRDGNLWIGTLGGVACMNPYNFACTVYKNEWHNLPGGNFDNKVFVDGANRVWTANSNGLYLLDRKQNTFERVWSQQLPGKPPSNYATSLDNWSADTLVMGTFTDIVLLNTHNFGFRRIAPLSKDVLVNTVHVDRQHRLWLGTWSEGCLVGNASLSAFQQFKWEGDKPTGVDNIATSFAEAGTPGSEAMWIAASWALVKIPVAARASGVDLSRASVCRLDGQSGGTVPATVGSLLYDPENFLWATGTSGVSSFSAEKSQFTKSSLRIDGFVQNIQSVSIGQRSYVAVSAWHGRGGLQLWDTLNGSVRRIASLKPGDQYGTNFSAVATDRLGRLWVATLAGAFVLDGQLQLLHEIGSGNESDRPTSKKINDILINNDTLWLACYKNGIDLYDLRFHKIRHFSDGDGSGLVDQLNERFFKDRKGTIWVCGNSFLYRYLPDAGLFRKYEFSPEHGSYGVNDLAELPDGHLVIATETEGLIYFNPVTEQFTHIGTALLEKEEAIQSVACDHFGSIWYLTSDHLVQYDPLSKKFALFGEEDGLKADALQLLRTFDGKRFFLAEAGGLLQFSPVAFRRPAAPPDLFLRAVQVNDSSISSPGPLHQLKLNYGSNKLYFEFDGITYTKAEQNQYAYRLNGIDRDWIYTNKNSVSYANVPPGDYSFEVKAAGYTGAWSRPYSVSIAIAGPYWKSWWFIALVALLVGSLFVFVVRYIAQRNLRERILKLEKEQAIEKERNRIARDMHDDLGSGLTRIAILSEVAKTRLAEKATADHQLETISHSSRELVDSLQNIIWVLNPKNDSLESLLDYIRDHALRFFDSGNTEVCFRYPEQIPFYKLSEEQRRNLFLVIKETLNNTAKHAGCTRVTIALVLDAGQLLVTLSDNGRGFDGAATRPFANGLANMKQRMEQIGGMYAIHSIAGEGTETRLTLPL